MQPNHKFIRRNWRTIFTGIAFCIDSIAIFSCGHSSWYLLSKFYIGPVLPLMNAVEEAVYFGGIFIFFALLIGLYRQSFFTNSNFQYLLAAKAYVYASVVILASFYMLNLIHIPRIFTVLYLFLLPFHFILGRLLLTVINYLFKKVGFGIHNILLVFTDHTGVDAYRQFSWMPWLGYNIHGILSTVNGAVTGNGQQSIGGMPYYPFRQLDKIVVEKNINRIFIPSTSLVAKGFHELLATCEKHSVKIKVVSPEATGLLQMARVYDIAGITLYSPPRRKIELLKRISKRLFDLIGASILIVLCSPLFLLTAVAIYLESGRPIIYKQRRVSTRGGKEFMFLKFRSMVKQADEIKETLMEQNEASGALFKMKNDPRITRMGRLIRKFSIDELPQLFNVFRGDMSLVGPRPLPIQDCENSNMSAEFWEAIKDRAKVKPGITGLWQISGRSDIAFNEMVLLDLYYVEHQSLLFDMEILFETIPAVLFGRGAY